MNLHGGQASRTLVGVELTIHVLDAGVDVSTIHRVEPGCEKRGHVSNGAVALNRAMITSELPATTDDAGDAVAGCERDCFNSGGSHHDRPGGNGTAVVSLCLNRRLPSRVMRKRVGQCGSGQATSASVLIQSAGCVTRCLAGSSGSSAASE